jgi:hypothetical protein
MWTTDQVLALAPDAASVAAGRKLASPRTWQGLGRDARAVWGQCQGSALYAVKADLADGATACTCPSRKFPCKHALGLLLMHAANQIPEGSPPAFVTEWTAKRDEKAAKAEIREAQAAEPVDEETLAKRAAAAEKRAEQRADRVGEGILALDTWMTDLVRNGLATLETASNAVFEQQAARLVDAQATGLASRVRRLGARIGDDGWANRALEDLGQLALLGHAFRRIDALDPELAATVRQQLGYPVDQASVLENGAAVADTWAIVGQDEDDDERLRTQRTWLMGLRTGRSALILQFAPGTAAFAQLLVPGSAFEATLRYYPGAAPERALIAERGDVVPFPLRLPGAPSIAAALEAVADVLAVQPWAAAFPLVLRDVVPAVDRDRWLLVDASGDALPSTRAWRLLAVSGGSPVDVAGSWDGQRFRPHGMTADGRYFGVGGGGWTP